MLKQGRHIRERELGKKGFLRSAMLYYTLIIILVSAHSCVDPYVAKVDDEPELISIEGSLIKGNAEQFVAVSKTVSLDYPSFIAVRGCLVSIIDDQENEFAYKERNDGTYSATFSDEQLVIGRGYKLRVLSSEAVLYESEYETLNGGVEVDSFYYDIEDGVDQTSGAAFTGTQFYVDVKATENESRYFRWKLEETYEYTSNGPISYYYESASLIPVEPYDPFAVYRCWKSADVSGIFISNTMNLTSNEKKKIPLNYVSNQTERLRIKYGLLLNQYTLNEGAYQYFEQNEIATQQSDGLYTRQPQQPMTNIYNVDDAGERVLGFFWVTTKTTKRIFVPAIDGMEVKPEYCPLGEFNAMEDGEGPFPIYIYFNPGDGKRYTSTFYCFDCTKRGGTNVAPDFWE